MKKIFLLILVLPLVSFAEGDPNLPHQPGGADVTSLGASAVKPCPMCVKKMLRGKQTGANPGAPSNNNPTDSGNVQTGI
jgi:hypothetical protein